MSVAKSNVNEIRPDQKWLYRLGGISGLLLGLGYIVIIVLYVPLGAPSSGAEARLAQVAANTSAWWGILGLSVLTDFLFLPLALALYFALKGINRTLMLLATICVALFVFLDLALTWTNYAALSAPLLDHQDPRPARAWGARPTLPADGVRPPALDLVDILKNQRRIK